MNDSILHRIFHRKAIAKFISKYIFFISLIIIVNFTIIITVFNSIWHDYEESITTSVEYSDLSITTLCSVLQCDAIIINSADGNNSKDRFYIKDKTKNAYIIDPEYDKKSYEPLIYNFTRNGSLTLNGGGYKIFISSDFLIDMLWYLFAILIIITVITYTIIVTALYLKRKKDEILHNRKLKDELELSLQRNITEMVHHELNAPMALIISQVDELYYNIFGFAHNTAGYLEKKIPKSKLANAELFEDIYLSVDRINSVLDTLSRSKHIKFNNGTVPLYTIIRNIESSINAFKVEKIKVMVDYSYMDLFTSHSIESDIGNGAMMNILHILYTNSMEAYATEIRITGELVDNKTLHMYVSDNGCGIKNEKGEYKVTQKIFTNGFSTKSKYRNSKETFLTRFFKIKPEISERGIGLYMVKSLLKAHDGDILLDSTSDCGTTFKLILPVKNTEKK